MLGFLWCCIKPFLPSSAIGFRLGLFFLRVQAEMALNLKIKLFLLEDENARLELVSPFFCHSIDTYANLRLRLEKAGYVECPFQF